MATLSRSSLLWLALGLLVGACGGGSSTDPPPPPPPPPPSPANLVKQAGDNQNGTVGAAVATAPAVRVTDAASNGLSGVAVTFAVASGGGTISGGSATTGVNGVATLSTWTLGTVPGANTLTASIAGSSVTGNPATFTATASAGPPAIVTKTAGDNQTTIAGTVVPVAPAVRVTDQFTNPLSGVAVSFAVATGGGTLTGGTTTTSAAGVATLGSWTLGAVAGANTLTATATGAGITGNPATFTATGTAAIFNPIANTNLGGTQGFTSVNIPAGVTVTITSDLILNATGAVTIAGNLVGNCVAVTINADGPLTLSGTIDNGCALGAIPDAGAPAMVLVGKGGWTLQAPGQVLAPGDVTLTNDPTLTDASFAPSAGAPLQSVRRGGPLASVGEPCVTSGAVRFEAKPSRAADGKPSGTTPVGGDGKDGSTFTLRCKGGSSISIGGNLTLVGQHGGNGGDGNHTDNTAAVASGGKGGKGGAVKIQAIDDIALGFGGSIFTGNGGAGGKGTADGSGGHGGNVGASAAATGGVGGSPGLFGMTAKNGSISISGQLELTIGDGGRGGAADATGGDGHDAPACPPAAGGPATATAGDGGSTPDKTLQAFGAVTGSSFVIVAGGAPGAGGNGVARAGKGGKGDQPCKNGAIGGDPTARGGKGGDANLRNMSGTKIANGGAGGTMDAGFGKGGQGWVDCTVPPGWQLGGDGGMGGTARGSNGSGGSGFQTGTYGAAVFSTVGNGGDGGNGFGPGAGGQAGSNSALLVNVAATIIDPSFQPGLPGNWCAGSVQKTFNVLTATSDFHNHEPVLLQVGSRTGTITNGSGTNSTMQIAGLIRNSSITLSGTRTGSSVSLTGSGSISTAFGSRSVTVTFTGTIGPNGLNGTLSILVSGFPQPVIYPVTDP